VTYRKNTIRLDTGRTQEEKLNIEFQSPRLIRLPEVEQRVGLKKTAVYEYIAAGEFPKPVPLTGKAVAWVESEITGWINGRIRQRNQVTA
jgi:prophage regulatory protein